MLALFMTVAQLAVVMAASPYEAESPGAASARSADVEYAVDDGVAEFSVGPDATPSTFIWLNQFDVQVGGEILTEVRIAWGVTSETEADIIVFHDPNNDGDPADITSSDLLDECLVSVTAGPTSRFTTYFMPDVPLGPAGSSFFVGVCMKVGPGETPAQLDYKETELARSWVAVDTLAMPFDCTDPNSASFAIPSPWLQGYWLIRAVGRTPVAVETTTWTRLKHLYQAP